MKKLEVLIRRCADCPYFDPFDGEDADFYDGWCCREQREIHDCAVVDFDCGLEDDKDV